MFRVNVSIRAWFNAKSRFSFSVIVRISLVLWLGLVWLRLRSMVRLSLGVVFC